MTSNYLIHKNNSNQHRQNQATGHANSRWFKFKFDSWSWGWFLRICSCNNSRRDWRSPALVSYGSGSARPIGTDCGVDLSRSGVSHLGNLETSPDDSVVKWLYGTEIADTCRGVSLPELTQKVHLRKRRPKVREKHPFNEAITLFLTKNRLVIMPNRFNTAVRRSF